VLSCVGSGKSSVERLGQPEALEVQRQRPAVQFAFSPNLRTAVIRMRPFDWNEYATRNKMMLIAATTPVLGSRVRIPVRLGSCLEAEIRNGPIRG
jgi:hypothetical protein